MAVRSRVLRVEPQLRDLPIDDRFKQRCRLAVNRGILSANSVGHSQPPEPAAVFELAARMLTNAVPAWWGALTSDQEGLGPLQNVALARWRVPANITVSGGRLYYPTDAFTMIPVGQGIPAPFKLVRNPGVQVLTDFVGLAEASDEEIKTYAQRWGVLGIRTHGWPPRSCPGASYREEWHDRFCPPAGYPGECSEPLFVWRAMARWARALLNAMAMLVRKQPIASEDWAVLTGAAS
jgi:hypothetical protein